MDAVRCARKYRPICYNMGVAEARGIPIRAFCTLTADSAVRHALQQPENEINPYTEQTAELIL